MHKAIALLLVVAATFAFAQPAKHEAGKEGDVAKAKRMAAVGPKDFDIKKLEGKWFNVGSSAAIHKMFVEGCTCNELEFKRLTDQKLHAVAACQNKEGKITAINGTLTMVRPQENKSLFHLAFTEKKGDVKGVEVNKTEAEKVKKIEKADDKQKGSVSEEQKGKAMKAEDANAIVLKVGDNFKNLVMGSPALDSAWILSRDRKFDDKLFDEYKKFLETNGFSSTKLKRIDHSKCSGDVLKGKAADAGASKTDRDASNKK